MVLPPDLRASAESSRTLAIDELLGQALRDVA
jgi:hypothetical protein